LAGLIVLDNDTNCIIKSLKGEVQVHETNLTLLLFIEVPKPSQESERSYTCVLEVSSA
jgi:hypothetical protein